MPNWVENKLVISGPDEKLNQLKEQLSQPYEREVEDWKTNEVMMDEVKGPFLFWNIIKPTDLNAYYQRGERAAREAERIVREIAQAELTPEQIAEQAKSAVEKFQDAIANIGNIEFDFAKSHADFLEGVETKDDWWNWNIRNWGTKWELDEDVSLTTDELGRLVYQFQTAWSPPTNAVSRLAEQYPDLTFTMWGIDEGDCFAYSSDWENGEVQFDQEIPITHDLHIEFYGYCWACENHADDPMDSQDWAELADDRERLGCPDGKDN